MNTFLAALPPANGPSPLIVALLWLIVAGVLFLPFAAKRVERNLEIFLLVMGSLSVTVAGLWSAPLIGEALREPVKITVAVLVAGLLFHYGRPDVDRAFRALRSRIPLRALLAIVVIGLGLLSSVVTAIIAALLLVEVVHMLRLDRKWEVQFTIIACFSIGLGAALTPLGEPLSTVVIAKRHEDFWYLFRLLGWYLVPGMAALGLLAGWMHPARSGGTLHDTGRQEPMAEVYWRVVRVYAFVAALVLLGAGLTPLVDRFIAPLAAALLFWVNMISAILDNATLAAAEVSPVMTTDRVVAVLLGLLISGGMLIPGNIPNIVAADHLRIASREWARFGVPLGLMMMAAAFTIWMVVGR